MIYDLKHSPLLPLTLALILKLPLTLSLTLTLPITLNKNPLRKSVKQKTSSIYSSVPAKEVSSVFLSHIVSRFNMIKLIF